MEAKDPGKNGWKKNGSNLTNPMVSNFVARGNPTTIPPAKSTETPVGTTTSRNSKQTMAMVSKTSNAASLTSQPSMTKKQPEAISHDKKLPSSVGPSSQLGSSSITTQFATAKASTLGKIDNRTFPPVNSGNDRVTVDNSHQPLVTTTRTPLLGAGQAMMIPKQSPRAGATSSSVLSTTKKTITSVPTHRHSLKVSAGSSPAPSSSQISQTAAASKLPAGAPLAPPRTQTAQVNSTSKKHPSSSSQGQQRTSISQPSSNVKHPSKTLNVQTGADSKAATPSPAPRPVAATPVSKPEAAHGPSSPLDEAALLEAETRKVRAPIVDTYSPYIIPSDTSLKDSRHRLRAALDQTRQLRAAFTERVYGKYRVCLRPPPTTEAIFSRISTDPATASQELLAEIRNLKEEKDIEKKEAQKLNAELMAANAGEGNAPAMNADNAEQLMFISAGLSLVILPEQDVTGVVDMSAYPDRAPTNPETGQRVRSISAAAAAAGEVILDRARKGAAMRLERQRRRQLQIMSGGDPERDSESNYSRLSVLSSSAAAAPPPVVKPSVPAIAVAPVPAVSAPAKVSKVVLPSSTFTKVVKRSSSSKPSAPSHVSHTSTTAKAIRARVQTNMSVNTLLSLHASNEELRTDGKASAATIALMEIGPGPNGANCKSQQQRMRHPFPESLGGRRRTVNPTGSKKENANAASNFSNQHSAYHSVTLPPVPSSKERRGRKRIAILDTTKASTARARNAIKCVLHQFEPICGSSAEQKVDNSVRAKKRRITQISFLHGIQKSGDAAEAEVKATECLSKTSTEASSQDKTAMSEKEIEKPIDPILAFNVLQAVGLITTTPKDETTFENDGFLSQLDASLFQSPSTKTDDDEGVQSRRSMSKLRSLHKKFSVRKRTFCEAFAEVSNEPIVLSRRSRAGSIDKATNGKIGSEQENLSPSQLKSDNASNSVSRAVSNSDEKDKTKTGVSAMGVDKDTKGKADLNQDPPIATIRGGGEVLLDSSESGNQAKSSGQQAMHGAQSNNIMKPSESATSDGMSNPQPGQDIQQQMPARPNGSRLQDQPTAPVHAPDMTAHRMIWGDDPSHQSLVLLNPRLSGSDAGYGISPAHQNPLLPHGNGGPTGPPGAHIQGQPHALDRYHHHSTANALQLAHHLRHATASISRLPPHGHHAAGDLADYLGGLHHSTQPPVGYDWSSIGAASAGAVALAQSSLAALGISPHRAAMANFQDRAARVLLAREQQTAAAAAAHAAAAHRQTLSNQQAVAFLGGAAGHAYAPSATPHFPNLHTAALLSSTALVQHSGMQPVPTSTPSSARLQPPKQDQRSVASSKKELGHKKEQTSKKEATPQPDAASKKDQSSTSHASSQKSQKKDEVVVRNKSDSAQTKRTSSSAKDEAGNSKKRKIDQEEASRTDKPFVRPEKKTIGEQKKTGQTKKLEKSLEAKDRVASTKTEPSAVSSNPITDARTLKSAQVNGSDARQLKAEVGGSKSEDPLKTQPQVSNEASAEIAAVAQKSIIPAGTMPEVKVEETPSVSLPDTRGMQFFVPPAPPSITAEIAGSVLAARSYEAIEAVESGGIASDTAAIVEYLISVGTAVPIPKALVANPLKERLTSPGFKSANPSSLHAVPREVVVASVLLWLWRHHEECFQRAFVRSGRIDVDPECKFLIQAAIDTAVRALTLDLADTNSRRSSSLASALAAHRGKGCSIGQKGAYATETDRSQVAVTKLDLITASIVSKSLMAALSLEEQMDCAIPQFGELVQYLDECRKCAFYSKAQERALLAALISRKATMSLPFSHAYVSSMVRAGEALGHGELFEIVQNEDVHVSTMIPYDVFTDESGAWEDPCRPNEGFTSNLTGDDLVRRAHGRAMIQKSLKKLQDRHNIKGGTSTSGAYADPTNSQSSNNSDSNSKGGSGSSGGSTPRGWFKRQRSSFSEPPVQPGTGSAAATSWSLYDPRHYSAPLLWKSDDVENAPYGRHDKNARPRSLSLSQVGSRHSDSSDKPTRGKASTRAMSFSSHDLSKPRDESDHRSTREIAWADVAGIFQRVTLPGASQAQKDKEKVAAPGSRTIFAPFVRRVSTPPVATEEESEDEEDLSDEAVVKRHQIVLDRMKEKLSEIFEARKKHQERRKNKKS